MDMEISYKTTSNAFLIGLAFGWLVFIAIIELLASPLVYKLFDYLQILEWGWSVIKAVLWGLAWEINLWNII